MPVYEHVHDTVQWHFDDIAYRLVAKSGNPADRFHLGKIILQSLEDNGDQILQTDGYTGEKETNASVLKRTKQCAVAFKKLGVQQDDVIALMAPNHLDLTIPLYAGLALGAPIAPVDRFLGVNELKDTFSILTPKIICCQRERVDDVKLALVKTGVNSTIISFDGGNGAIKFSDLIKEENEDDFLATTLDPLQTAMLVPTSGTTGLPKYAEITHRNFVSMSPSTCANSVKIPPFGSFLVAAPLQWLSAITMYLNAPILKMSRIQSTLNLTQEHAYDLINKYKPTFLALSPTMMTTLIKAEEREKCDFSCFEIMVLGGSVVHSDLIAELQKIVPNTTVVIGYGMTELTGRALEHKYSTPSFSCGKPLRNYQYRLVDLESGKDVIDKPNVNGELWMKGPGIFKGYYKNPETTKETFSEDGWFKTGDVMYRDENWNFYYVERIKLLLKYRNHQISPVELECVIRQHPGVLDVAVTGIPDVEHGDLPVACVVTKSGYKVTEQEIKDLVKANLTDTKQLRGGVLFLNELPMTASTKVHRRNLKELVLNAKLG